MGNACDPNLDCYGWKPCNAHRQLTTNLARAAKPTMISAQLGPHRGSCPMGHMQAMPTLASALISFGHELTTAKSTYLSGIERRGNAQSGKLQMEARTNAGDRTSVHKSYSMTCDSHLQKLPWLPVWN